MDKRTHFRFSLCFPPTVSFRGVDHRFLCIFSIIRGRFYEALQEAPSGTS